jgi:hypothetical protein
MMLDAVPNPVYSQAPIWPPSVAQTKPTMAHGGVVAGQMVEQWRLKKGATCGHGGGAIPRSLREGIAPVWEWSLNGPSQFGPTGTLLFLFLFKQILDMQKIYVERKIHINFKLEQNLNLEQIFNLEQNLNLEQISNLEQNLNLEQISNLE